MKAVRHFRQSSDGDYKLESNPILGSLRWLRFSFFILLVVAGGCNNGRPAQVLVSGKVTVDGVPVEHGAIAFYPVSGGRLSGGQLGGDGRYSVSMYKKNDGLPPGKYNVTVGAVDWFSDKAGRWHAPKRYQDVETSGLSIEITEEVSDLEIKLTWEGDKHSKPWVEKL